jgi:hypothetical protein
MKKPFFTCVYPTTPHGKRKGRYPPACKSKPVLDEKYGYRPVVQTNGPASLLHGAKTMASKYFFL